MRKAMTGVGCIFSASHRDQETGNLHGHTWEIVAWVAAGRSALVVQRHLQIIVGELDHTMLPDELAWGESIAEHIARRMTLSGFVVLQIDVNRSAERIYARWPAL